MPQLVGAMLTMFVTRLENAERVDDKDEWEEKFVDSLRFKFDGREAEQDMGVNPWNPTVHQWNHLGLIAERAR